MPITTIPAQYRAGFAKIKALSPSEFENLATAIESAAPASGLKQTISTVLDRAPDLKRGEVESILRTLYSLCFLLSDEETPLSEHLSQVMNAMQATGKEELALTEQQKTEFQNRVSRLLSLNTVVISSKVERLRLDYHHTFHDATILSDIRPIFNQPEERPIGCAIAHTLEIEYHEEGEHKEFYVVLDDNDIKKMKRIIQRAELKALSLKSLLKSCGLPDLSR